MKYLHFLVFFYLTTYADFSTITKGSLYCIVICVLYATLLFWFRWCSEMNEFFPPNFPVSTRYRLIIPSYQQVFKAWYVPLCNQ